MDRGYRSRERSRDPAPARVRPSFRNPAIATFVRRRAGVLISLSGILLLATLGLSGCTPTSQRVGVLWTSEPYIAPYVDQFNASQNDYRIVTNYHANPSADLAAETDRPDLVIGRYLTDQKTRRQFSSLNALFANGRIDRNAFYADALGSGKWGGDQLLIPVSFDLPAIMFLKGSLPAGTNGFFLTPQEMRTLGAAYNKMSDGRFVQVGYSPRWSTDFQYEMAALYQVGFHQEAPGRPGWRQENLNKVVAYLRDWITAENGSQELDSAFTEKYLYEPRTQLVTDGKIRFAYTTATQYFEQPDSRRGELDIRWLADGDRVPVLENVLYAGIPIRSRHHDAAVAFLEWFFRVDTQRKLVAQGGKMQIDSFGVANGLSALKQINEEEFPKRYPGLIGHVPSHFSLEFPQALPVKWSDIRAQVVLPWLSESITTNSTPSPLLDKVRAWILQQGE